MKPTHTKVYKLEHRQTVFNNSKYFNTSTKEEKQMPKYVKEEDSLCKDNQEIKDISKGCAIFMWYFFGIIGFLTTLFCILYTFSSFLE